MKASKVEFAINNGEFTEAELGRLISTAIEQRKAMVKARAIKLTHSLEPGDKVEVVGNIKPRYMLGHSGVVVQNEERMAKAGFIWVDFGGVVHGRTRSWGPRVCMPASCLKKVS